jgi:arylsulfatase A-like enzyme
MVILDTVRARQLDLYGYPRATAPTLAELGEGAVVFERAMSPSPSSLPGHAALLTGLLPHEIEADWRKPIEEGPVTLGEVLQARGYATAAFSGNLFYFTEESGLARGFHHFSGYHVSPGQAVRSTALGQFLIAGLASVRAGRGVEAPVGWITEGKSAERVLDELERWLATRPERPLFLTVNFLDAHRPYDPPEPFRSRFLRGCPRTMTVPQCVALTRTDLYDGAVAHVDHALSRLLSLVETEGILADAVVVVTSDHGELLGEYGLVGHGNSLYWPALHVPLVVRLPGLQAGRRISDPVSLADVPRTLAALAGVSDGGGIPGKSLEGLWTETGSMPSPDTLMASARGSINRPPEEPLARGDLYALLGWPLQYIRNGDGSEELYNVADPRSETRDLARTPLGGALGAPFRSALDAALEARR